MIQSGAELCQAQFKLIFIFNGEHKIGSWEWLLSPMLNSIPTSKWKETIFPSPLTMFSLKAQTHLNYFLKIIENPEIGYSWSENVTFS